MARDPTTKYLVLGMLSIEPRSGYDIKKTVESSMTLFWRESYGQIYPALEQLLADGLIIERRGKGAVQASRRIFNITASGRKALRAWLAVPPRPQAPRDEFLLKLFFGREAAPEVVAMHIATFRIAQEQLRGELEAMSRMAAEQNAGNTSLPFWELTMRLGILHAEASIQWAIEAEKALAPANKNASGRAAAAR